MNNHKFDAGDKVIVNFENGEKVTGIISMYQLDNYFVILDDGSDTYAREENVEPFYKDKKIDMYYINKIKHLDYKIFEYEDDEYVNRKGIIACERNINKYITQVGITDECLRDELRRSIIWNCDSCVKKLLQKGWKVFSELKDKKNKSIDKLEVIGICKKCGRSLYRSVVEGYESYCSYCDEDFYSFEQDCIV